MPSSCTLQTSAAATTLHIPKTSNYAQMPIAGSCGKLLFGYDLFISTISRQEENKNKIKKSKIKTIHARNLLLTLTPLSQFQTNYVYLVENVVKPLLGASPDPSILDAEAPKWHKAASILDTRLHETKKWILPGENPTIVDIAVASAMHLHEAQKLPLEQHPGLKRWIADVEALSAWKGTQEAVEKALLPGKGKN